MSTRAARRPADIVREYGPFDGVPRVNGVTHDGRQVWAATGSALVAIDTASGSTGRRIAQEGCDAGTAFDGRHFWQVTEQRIDKIDAASGHVLGSIPAPGGGASGLAWAEGSLWVGQYRERRIHQVDPATGAVLRTIESDRFVTGVTWVDGELWHAVWEGDESELRHVDPADGAVLERLEMPAGTGISGLESDGAGLFYCGGGGSGKVRAVRRPRKAAA